MPDNERKTSEDLIREANERLRAAESEPDPTAGSSDQEPDVTERPTFETPREPRRETSSDEQPAGTVEDRPDSRHDGTSQEVPSGPIEERPERRKWSFGWVRWGLAALVFGGWFLFTSLDDASRDDTGEIVGGGDLDVMALRVGDCFDDAEEVEEVLFDVAAVPCSEPHDNEVFSVQTVSGELNTDNFPGQTVLQEYAYEVCSGPVFDTFVGTPYLDSVLEVFTITPTGESWDEGDREFVCALYRLDFAKLTGSAQDSGL